MIFRHSDTEIQKFRRRLHITIKIINSIDQIDIFTQL